jgi:endonuclease/exonuclease/phosphatase (EEP) superfamily protein YafD
MNNTENIITDNKINYKTGILKSGRIINITLISAVSVLTLLPFLGYLGGIFWVFGLFIHFKIQYIYGLVILGLIAFFFRKFLITISSFLSIILCLLFSQPLQIKFTSANGHYKKTEETCRVMFFNIDYFKNNKADYINHFIEADPDILILAEVSPPIYSLFKEKLYQYTYSNYSINPNSDEPDNGIAMFSRIAPLDGIKVVLFGEGTCPSMQINIKNNGKKISVIGTHPYSPVNKRRVISRDKQFLKLAEYIRNESAPVLLIGDMNSTVWEPEFKELLKRAGLINSMDNFGMQNSWPAYLPPFFRIPIDHVLYTNGIALKNKIVGPALGSDHLPVIADFSVE